MKLRWFSSGDLLATALTVAIVLGTSFGAPLSQDIVDEPSEVMKWTAKTDMNDTVDTASTKTVSAGAFPVCTDFTSTFPPFCLPHDGTDVIVDATYYVTWNADFYPLNATITIELRYSNSSEGDSAFTSERTDNSYGYVPLHMRKEWLQDKPHNTLTLYIIELDSISDRRASARQGPTVVLLPKPVEPYKPPPPLPFNKLALIIGLPVSVGVVMLIVCALSIGMWRSRKNGIEHIRVSRNKGYGIGKSKNQRMEEKNTMDEEVDALATMKKYSDANEGMSEISEPDLYHELYTGNYVSGTRVGRLKSWSG